MQGNANLKIKSFKVRTFGCVLFLFSLPKQFVYLVDFFSQAGTFQ